MLIEETAIGNYPKEALETIDRIIKYVESQNSLTENDVKNSDQKNEYSPRYFDIYKTYY